MANCCCCWLSCCCCCCICCSSCGWNNFICSFWACIWDINCSAWALWDSRSSLLSWSSCSFISRIFSSFSLNHSIASPHLLLFFSFFPSSFSVSYLFLVWLNLSIALSLISIVFFFSPSTSFLASSFCSFVFSDFISYSTNSSTSFSASLISLSPPPLSLSSCLTFTRHFFARISERSLTNREMTGIPSATRKEATTFHNVPLSGSCPTIDKNTLGCHSSQEFDIFLFSPHHYRSNNNHKQKLLRKVAI